MRLSTEMLTKLLLQLFISFLLTTLGTIDGNFENEIFMRKPVDGAQRPQ